ncbi:MAG TPA: TonB-dependent receptor [Opitutus sp.]|nr:TonB-dependent receptor [Opitutus sp.]
MNPMHPRHGLSLGASALLLALGAFSSSFALAQPRTGTSSDEVITLEDFQITAEGLENTYIATEAIAGTRTGDKIIDIPFSIQVFTEDFVNDFQLFNDDDLLAYVSAATTNTGTSTGIRVRGFNALVTRDGFQYAMPGTPSNTLQTEIIKGPLSTLYGRATPGGIINKTSRRPTLKPKHTASATYGTDNFLRYNATSSGPLIKDKLYYLAYAEYQRAKPAHENYIDGNEKLYFGLSFLYKFAEKTSLSATFEYQPESTQDSAGGIILLPPTGAGASFPADVPYITGNPAKGIRHWQGVGDYSAYGPQNGREADYYGLNLLFEHRISQALSFRAAFQTYSKVTDKDRWSGGDQYRYSPTGIYAGSNDRRPFRQHQDEKNYAGQMDLLAKFKTNNVTHRILAAVDSAFFTRDDLQLLGAYTANGTGPDKLPTSFAGRRLSLGRVAGQWSDEPVNAGGYGVYDFDNIRTRNADYTWEKFTAGALLSYRASMLDDKLATMASGRVDYYDDLYDNGRMNRASGTLSDTAFTYSFGTNYKILGEKLLVYASISTGFEPSSTVDDGIDALVPPEESFGYEAGFKGNINEGKAGYTISFYAIDLDNVRSANPDFIAAGQGIPRYSLNSKNSATGIDANSFIKPFPNLTIQAALGYTDSNTDRADDSFALGQPLQYVAKWNGSLTVRYEIPELRITTGVGVRAQSEYLVNYETATINSVWRPGLALADCFINYKWKWGRTVNKMSINLRNITNEKYYTNTGRLNYGFESRFTYSLNF